MIIHPESHLARVGALLHGLRVLEVGCGDGYRSRQLVDHCAHLVGIDPDAHAIAAAGRIHGHSRIDYAVASAEALPFAADTFGAVLFVLSLHHVPQPAMALAIDEALRVARRGAPIIFIEPGFHGSFFSVDARFGACDGDERLQKALAYAAILAHPGLEEVEEFLDVTRYTFASARDFMDEFRPRGGSCEEIEEVLASHGFELTGERRINVCRARA